MSVCTLASPTVGSLGNVEGLQQLNEVQGDGPTPQAQRPLPSAAGSLLNTLAVLLAVVAVMMIPILSQLNLKT